MSDSTMRMPDPERGRASIVFDRLDGEFGSAAEAREALYGELTGQAAGREEYNPERPIEDLRDDVDR